MIKQFTKGRLLLPVISFMAIFLASSIALSSCSAGKKGEYSSSHGITAPVEKQGARLSYQKIAVWFAGECCRQDEFSALPDVCPITRFSFDNVKETPPGANGVIAGHLIDWLSDKGFEVALPLTVSEAVSSIGPGVDRSYSVETAAEVGRLIGADALFTGYLMRYEERKGGRYSVDRPASVAFSLALISVDEGKVVWKGKFDKTQKALFSDLTDFRAFFSGGMVWQTAEELSGYGVTSLLEKAKLARPARGAM